LRHSTPFWLAFAALFLSVGAAAEPYEDGMAAFARKDYPTALRYFQPLAEHGDVRAQSDLGTMYMGGWGVARDHVEAARWYRRAADHGFAPAERLLGVMYENGDGVQGDLGQALRWVRKAAAQGDHEAQWILSYMYRDNRFTSVDYVQAYKWRLLAGPNYSPDELHEIAANMTPAQIAEAEREASSWSATP
jgi:TPR repeat protein